MSESAREPDPRETFRRYAGLITSALRSSGTAGSAAFSAEDQRLVVVDRTGHSRPVYRPLLAYCWLQAFALAYEVLPRSEFGRWEEALRTWCDDLEARLGEFVWPSGPLYAALGDRAAEAAWIALALRVAGKVFIRDAWTDLAGDVFGKLTKRQQESGAFLAGDLSDNPETRWYHELLILHAVAAAGMQSGDADLITAAKRNAAWHLAETQPDHATNQPWGLLAFLLDPATFSLADGLLHNAAAQPAAGGWSLLTLMLLGDALYCARFS